MKPWTSAIAWNQTTSSLESSKSWTGTLVPGLERLKARFDPWDLRIFETIFVTHSLTLDLSLQNRTVEIWTNLKNLDIIYNMCHIYIYIYRLLRWLTGEESPCQCWRHRFDPWIGKIPWRRKWQSNPIFLHGESHGQRSLAGCSPPGSKRVGHNWANTQTHTNLCVLQYTYMYVCMSLSVCVLFYLYMLVFIQIEIVRFLQRQFWQGESFKFFFYHIVFFNFSFYIGVSLTMLC